MKTQSVYHDLCMRGIKIIDIAYISILYFGFSFACAKATDNYFGRVIPEIEQQKPFWQITAESIGAVCLFGVAYYLIRNVIERIPFPLDGYMGFSHHQVIQLNSSTSVFSLVYLFFSNFLQTKLNLYYMLF